MNIVLVLIFFSIYSYETCAQSINYGHAVQIVSSFNHSLNVLEGNIKETLQSANINDHHVVIASMVGKQGGGKSFLMNLLIRILESKYKKLNISDWQRRNENLIGFDYGPTQGIWMWSEIFTHKLKNGEKIAIILLDTQGLFDRQKHNETEDKVMLTLSSMIASIQCFNLMRIITRSDVEYFNLTSKHNDLVLKNSRVEMCENRNLIVRDKPEELKNFKYGWQDQEKIKEIFSKNEQEILDKKLNLFYMPSPGDSVTEKIKFDGNLNNVRQEFLHNVEELALELFAPENLPVKIVNGKKMQVGDFVAYLKKCLKFLES